MQANVASSRPALDSLPRIIRNIPRHCLDRQSARSLGYLARDLVLAGLLITGILMAHSWLVAVPLALVLGTVLTGLFVVGHDAGHRSFSNSRRLNNFVGHVATTPLLWPFHVWRLSHDYHHRWTHHSENEIAWQPLTTSTYQRLPGLARFIYKLSRSTLFFWASMLFQFFFVKDAAAGKFFDRKDAADLRFSLRLTAVVFVAEVGLSCWAGGVYGLVCLFVLPMLTFHFWLSTFTLFHHTSVDNELLPPNEWTPERAQLTMSVQVFYPRIIDWLTHDIAWHVPHHVCVGVPHYRLREAHHALKKAYPDLVQERHLTWELVRSVTSTCHLVASREAGGLAWLPTSAVGNRSQEAVLSV